MNVTEFRFMDLVRVERDQNPGIVMLDPGASAQVSFYEGALGRVVGVKSGQQITVWFPIPGYPEPKPQLGTFMPKNLDLVKRPTQEEFNNMAYPFPLDK